ncbi:MAG: glyoxalase III HchA [Pseudomonadota bacterium]
MLKKLFGLAPQREIDGSYSPSPIALKLATKDTTDYTPVNYQAYKGKQSKILVVFTEQKNMPMANGNLFSTGNHPVETLLPMLHLQNAGFEFEIATPSGQPVVFEMWAFPEKDTHVKAIYQTHRAQFERPTDLSSLTGLSLPNADDYAAIFIPGGHGAMLGLPQDKNLSDLLHWAHNHNLFTISLCHGPAALLSTTLDNNPFLYNGYNMAVFPDSVDNITPMIGYLPGKMTWGLSAKLAQLGATVVNKKADNSVCVDRHLITGASPDAANELGKIAAETLLAALT